MADKATKFHVADASVWEEKFPDANVTFVDDHESDAIESVTAATSASAWYTLSGMKLKGEPTQKGFYVKDGRKVMVK